MISFPDDIDRSRHMLVELLKRRDDGPVIGTEKLAREDRMFLLVTCAAQMMEFLICVQCNYDAIAAINGVNSLAGDMREHVIKRCKQSQ